MAGIVLALAVLTCGDGGPGLGAAKAPVALPFFSGCAFSGRWVGMWEGTGWQGARDVRTVELADGVLRTVTADGVGIRYDGVKVTVEGAGALRMTIWSDVYHPAIYRYDCGRLVICVSEGGKRPEAFQAGRRTVLLTLRPAAPRKP
jgi:hypothetical protein